MRTVFIYALVQFESLKYSSKKCTVLELTERQGNPGTLPAHVCTQLQLKFPEGRCLEDCTTPWQHCTWLPERACEAYGCHRAWTSFWLESVSDIYWLWYIFCNIRICIKFCLSHFIELLCITIVIMLALNIYTWYKRDIFHQETDHINANLASTKVFGKTSNVTSRALNMKTDINKTMKHACHNV